eukprot:TRINITY_DN93035_c0_g1_i1.p1 TRINITY_DN93035_c0_g1~~TRINITY_DN93035_c0_g1_i1.p1  ORF type:complete len:1557 (+),score=167.65 TRINITY_DN93035_c0_g1_i1:129-4799(+)
MQYRRENLLYFWESHDPHTQQWLRYAAPTSQAIEWAFQQGLPAVAINVQPRSALTDTPLEGWAVVVEFRKQRQYNPATRGRRPVRRVDAKTGLPTPICDLPLPGDLPQPATKSRSAIRGEGSMLLTLPPSVGNAPLPSLERPAASGMEAFLLSLPKACVAADLGELYVFREADIQLLVADMRQFLARTRLSSLLPSVLATNPVSPLELTRRDTTKQASWRLDHSQAVYAYSYHIGTAGSQLDTCLNIARGSKNLGAMRVFDPFCRWLREALALLPRAPRGLGFRILDKLLTLTDRKVYRTQQSIQWPAFTTLATEWGFARTVAEQGVCTRLTIFTVHHQWAADTACFVGSLGGAKAPVLPVLPANTELVVTTLMPSPLLAALGGAIDVISLRETLYELPDAVTSLDERFAALKRLAFVFERKLFRFVAPAVDQAEVPWTHWDDGMAAISELFAVQECIGRFNGPAKVIVVTGASGSGKTTLALRALYSCICEKSSAGRPVFPLFVRLQLVDCAFAPHRLGQFIQSEGDFSEAELAELKRRPILLVLAGYEEIVTQHPHVQSPEKFNLVQLNGLDGIAHNSVISAWARARVIITCREDVCAANSKQNFAPRGQPHQFRTLRIRPLDSSRVQRHLRWLVQPESHAVDPDSAAIITRIGLQRVPGLLEVLATPFMLEYTIPVLPNAGEALRSIVHNRKATRWDVFGNVTRRCAQRFFAGSAAERLLQFADSIAQFMLLRPVPKGTASVQHVLNLCLVGEADSIDILSKLPLYVDAARGIVAFTHRSLLEFHCARYLVHSDMFGDKFAAFPLSTNVVKFLAESLCSMGALSHAHRSALERLVTASRSGTHIQAASNAASVLSNSGHSFSRLDLSAIHLHQASLRKANLYGTNLRGAQLREVDFTDALLDFADLTDARLEDSEISIGNCLELPAEITSTAMHPSTGLIATACTDGICRLWRCSNLTRIPVPLKKFSATTASSPLTCVALSSDGRRVASATADGILSLWGTDGTELNLGKCAGIACLLFSSDKSRLICGCADGQIRQWFTENERDCNQSLTGHTKAVLCLAGDGALLASGSGDGTARLWEKDVQVRQFAHNSLAPIGTLQFSPCGTTLLTGSWDSTVCLWRVSDGQEIACLAGHTARVSSLAYFSPTVIVSGSDDGTLRFWSDPGFVRLRCFTAHTGAVTGIARLPDGSLLTAGRDARLRLWDLSPDCAELYDLAFSADEELLGTVNSLGSVKIWGLGDASELQCVDCPVFHVTCCTLRHDGSNFVVITGTQTGTAYIWEALIDKERMLRKLKGHTAPLVAVAMAQDCQTFATSGEDLKVMLWDRDSNPLCSLPQEALCRSMSFTVDGCVVVTGGISHACVWGREGSAKFQLMHNSESPLCVAASKAIIATASEAKVVIWSLETGVEQFRLAKLPGQVESMALSQSGRLLLIGCSNHTAVLWDPTTLAEPCIVAGHTEAVKAVSFTRSAETFATASSDQTARVWARWTLSPRLLAVLGRHSTSCMGTTLPTGALMNTNIAALLSHGAVLQRQPSQCDEQLTHEPRQVFSESQ